MIWKSAITLGGLIAASGLAWNVSTAERTYVNANAIGQQHQQIMGLTEDRRETNVFTGEIAKTLIDISTRLASIEANLLYHTHKETEND